jgi:hypothetical protein
MRALIKIVVGIAFLNLVLGIVVLAPRVARSQAELAGGCVGTMVPPLCSPGSCSGSETCQTNPDDTANCYCHT